MKTSSKILTVIFAALIAAIAFIPGIFGIILLSKYFVLGVALIVIGAIDAIHALLKFFATLAEKLQ